MKRIYSALALLSALLLLGSCSSELDSLSGGERGGARQVSFSLNVGSKQTASTRATTDGIVTSLAAFDREKKLHNVYAVVFNLDGTFYKTFPFATAATANPDDKQYRFTMPLAGHYYMYVVANTNINLADANITKDFTSEEKFYQYVNTELPGENKNQTSDKFLMMSPKMLLDIEGNDTTRVGNIDLTRAVARIDIDCSAIEGMKISQIRWDNRYTTTYFARGEKGSDMTDAKLKRTTNYVVTKPSSPDVTDQVWRGCLYGYENLYSANEETATEFPTKLTLTATCDGINITHSIVFENVPLLRNHLYNVVLKPAGTGAPFNELEYQIQVADWDNGTNLQYADKVLVKGVTPDFTIDGAYFQKATAGKNPTEVYTWQNESEFKVIATGQNTSFVLNSNELTADQGYVTREPLQTNLDGTFVQTFTVHLKQTLESRYKEIPFTLANGADSTLNRSFKLIRVKLPIEYLADTNLKTIDELAPNNHTAQSGYFTWQTAYDRYNWESSASNRMINGKSYHIPTQYEWLQIVPLTKQSDWIPYTRWDYSDWPLNNQWWITDVWMGDKLVRNPIILPATNKAPLSSTRGTTSGIAYGFFQQQSPYAVAVRWQYCNTDPDNPGLYILKITQRYMGYQYGTQSGEGINAIADENFWNDASQNQNDITKKIPVCGYVANNGQNYPAGTKYSDPQSACYWTATPVVVNNATYYYGMNATSQGIYCQRYWGGGYSFSVRLFCDE